MEVNRDEALRCLDIGRARLESKDFEGAQKFLLKSRKLFATPQADAFERELAARASAASSSASTPSGSTSKAFAGQSGAGSAARGGASDANASDSSSSNLQKEYSQEQVHAVKRILKCKCYYEVLDIARDASDVDIKKAYKKMALQFHPDKNGAPGADEAFKVISEAFVVLSDEQKRKHYDMYGKKPRDGPGQTSWPGPHGAAGSPFGGLTPEELFEMLFSGGMPGMRGPGVRVYTTAGRRSPMGYGFSDFGGRSRPTRPSDGNGGPSVQRPANANNSWISLLLQFLPVIILMWLMSPSSSSKTTAPPPFALKSSSLYTVERSTKLLDAEGLKYYVQPAVASELERNPRKVANLERQVDDFFISELEKECRRETYMRKTRQNTADGRVDVQTESKCEQLEGVRRRRNAGS